MTSLAQLFPLSLFKPEVEGMMGLLEHDDDVGGLRGNVKSKLIKCLLNTIISNIFFVQNSALLA